MTTPIRVLLVDDQELFREGLHTLLSVQADLQVIGEARNGEEAIRLAATLKPDIILMDLRMPVMDGVSATRHLHAIQPECKVIVLTTFDDDEDVFEGLRAGAVGYLLKDVPSEKLIEALRTASRGESFLHPSIASKVIAEFTRISPPTMPTTQSLIEPLSERELAILRQREHYRAIHREFFRHWDVLLTPTTITPAFPHIDDQIPLLKRRLRINNTNVPYTYLPIYAGIASYSGLPATAFPWGQSKSGLPIGFQAIGPYQEDLTTIKFASLLEHEYGTFTPPTNYL